ncbi:phosphoribosyltransferase family protein, partial [Burkholderia sp. Se-20378]|uniref:phosphoribosyltransferase family protein n=1 Tax=Burkholderia sp. Se-20378 TaxID=2703899 RepID=UPI002402B2C3
CLLWGGVCVKCSGDRRDLHACAHPFPPRRASDLRPVEGRIAIVVDDGVATGASMRVALQALRERHPARIVAAAPVAPAGTRHVFDDLADAFVTVSLPLPFFGISQFYARFEQTSDDEVRALLDAARL